jgi:hypothetical protein
MEVMTLLNNISRATPVTQATLAADSNECSVISYLNGSRVYNVSFLSKCNVEILNILKAHGDNYQQSKLYLLSFAILCNGS